MSVARDFRDGTVATPFLEGEPVPALTSTINTAEHQFTRNHTRMRALVEQLQDALAAVRAGGGKEMTERDRKSTRLNSSHVRISYAVFCLKKKNSTYDHRT